MHTNSEIRAIGKGNFLKKRWLAVAALVIVTMVTGAVTGIGSSVRYTFDGSSSSSAQLIEDVASGDFDVDNISDYSNDSDTSLATELFALPLMIISMIISLAATAVTSVMTFGSNKFMIDLNRNAEQADIGTLFSGFKYFVKCFALSLVMGIFISLWSLLCIVPGIIAAYRYSMAFYILADNPNIGIMDAIAKSKEMMKGHKGELFCMDFFFIGWDLLSMITCGITGVFYSNPYKASAHAAFYLDKSGTLPTQGAATIDNQGYVPAS